MRALRTPAAHRALAAAALAGLLVSVSFRTSGLSKEAVTRRDASLVADAEMELERDAAALQRIAAQVQKERDFAAIVDGGGAEVRPAQLFSVLARSLPSGEGWGAAFYDSSGRSVAWIGEAGPPPVELFSVEGFDVSFHVTRFSVSFRSPRGTSSERRGLLVVSRRYPTGILGADLGRLFSPVGGLTERRLRVRLPIGTRRAGLAKHEGEARREGLALVDVFLEPAPETLAEDDALRARSRVPAVLTACALLALAFTGTRARAAVLGISLVAARLVLLLGTPRSRFGAFQPFEGGGISPFDLGLLATPADLALTGLLALMGLRLARSRGWPATGRAGSLGVALAALSAVGFLALPFLLGFGAGASGIEIADGMNLVPGSFAELLTRVGTASLAVACFGFSLLLFGSLRASLSHRSSRASLRDPDFLSRGAQAALLLFVSLAVVGAGVLAGQTRRLDRLLMRAEGSFERPSLEDEQPALWEETLSDPALEPWLPAGERTRISDLARALWGRGATADFPDTDDVLTIRDAAGQVVSSFGMTRPGTETKRSATSAALPLPGLIGTFTHISDPREADIDPLLAAAEEVPRRPTVERLEYDLAGRPRGAVGFERFELAEPLLSEVRRTGKAQGMVSIGGTTRRVRLRARTDRITGVAVRGESRLSVFGTAAAVAETSLPIVLLVLAASRPRRRELVVVPRADGRVPFDTFRSRLVALILASSAIPLFASIFAVRVALERHSEIETRRRALSLLAEARRALEAPRGESLGGAAEPVSRVPTEYDLNGAARVIGSDLHLYREGRLVAASRAVPVAAEVAGERLTAEVAESLAEGSLEASAARRIRGRAERLVEAATVLAGEPPFALVVVVAEDAAAREVVDGLILLAVAVALSAFGLGGRAALSLGRPLQDLIAASEKIGLGERLPRLARPDTVDLARLVTAFETMGERVRERTESLEKERAAAVALLSRLTAAVLLFEQKNGRVLLANPRADELLPGDDLWERLAAPSWEPVRRAVREGLKGEALETRVTIALPKGPDSKENVEAPERTIRVALSPLQRGDAGERRSVLVLEDLTDFIRADRLTAWLEATRAIAHDLKNPLTPIRLSAERLLRQAARGERPTEESIAAPVATILRQTDILTERIGRLSRFANPASLAKERLDRPAVGKLLDEIAADFSAHARFEVDVTVGEGLPVCLADLRALRDVLTNFVLNAIEAIGEGAGRVRLSAEAADGGVRFACEDDGPGVPEPQLQRLFDPTFSTKSRGSGMGLAAARSAVEAHGGSVFAHRREPRGLVIGFTIPPEGR